MDTVHCPGCGAQMDERRAQPDLAWLTQGVCSTCVTEPVATAKKIERERRVAAFGEGRC